MADDGEQVRDGLGWKEYVDGLFEKVQRDVDVARETVPKGIPWQDHIIALLGERDKTFNSEIARLTERGNAQDHLAEVVQKNADKNVDTANTAAKEAIGRTEAYARETIGRVEQVATLNDKNANDKIEILLARQNSYGGAERSRERATDRGDVTAMIWVVIVGVGLSFLVSVASIVTSILLHKP